MRKTFLIGLLIVMSFCLIGCNKDNNSDIESSDSNNVLEESKKETSSTAWPSTSIFPKPEGCKIEEVKKETNGFYYITVKWDDFESAKSYIEKVKEVEGKDAEIIGQGETNNSVYYGSYGITVSSEYSKYNIVLYK